MKPGQLRSLGIPPECIPAAVAATRRLAGELSMKRRQLRGEIQKVRDDPHRFLGDDYLGELAAALVADSVTVETEPIPYRTWGADGIDNPGTRNWMGMNSPAAEAMIDKMMYSDDQTEYRSAVQAFDLVPSTGRYANPVGVSD